MPQYEAKYVIKANMCDGGAWMPDPEAHNRSYRFDAKNEAEAGNIAVDYKSVVGKDFFGPTVSLDSLVEMRVVAVPDELKAARTVKRLKYDGKLEALVDEKGVKYEGVRFGTVSAGSNSTGKSSSELAETEVLSKLKDIAITRSADAYEIICSHIKDSRQEYDPTPYTSHITAILYKSK